jgi:hypothetical protein
MVAHRELVEAKIDRASLQMRMEADLVLGLKKPRDHFLEVEVFDHKFPP